MITLKLFTNKNSMIKKILSIGVPFGLENGLFYLGRIIVLSLVATFGTAAIAANAVSGTIVMFQVLPGMAIGLGLTVVISRCVGAGDYEQAKYYNKRIMKVVVPETLKNHYDLLEHHASECIECVASMKSCPFGVDIINKLC